MPGLGAPIINPDEEIKLAQRLMTSMLGGPADLLNLISSPFVNAARNFSAVLDKKPIPEADDEPIKKGTTRQLRESAGLRPPEDDSIVEILAQALSPDPLSKIGLLGAIIPAARAGKLTEFGKKMNDVTMLSHDTPVGSLEDILMHGHLRSPSIASSRLAAPFGGNDPGVASLIFKPGALDSHDKEIFPRDVWTAPGNTRNVWHPRSKSGDSRLTANSFHGGFPVDTPNALMMLAAERFDNYIDYLNSPTGAGILTSDRADMWAATDKIFDTIRDDYDNAYRLYKSLGANKPHRAAETALISRINDYTDDLRGLPAHYGETKLHDNLPINPDTVGGILFNDSATAKRFMESLPDITAMYGGRIGTPSDIIGRYGGPGNIVELTEEAYRDNEKLQVLPYKEFLRQLDSLQEYANEAARLLSKE